MPDSPLEFPDRRALERTMKEIARQISGDRGVETPLDRAQDLMYEAFGERDPEVRVRLARRALEISPDCADAYVLLAENAQSRKEALEYFEKGVTAGERALGPGAFEEHAGHFWGVLETRPYMRAREGLACELWTMGRGEEAVAHLQEMLRLNPNDNQGVRYTLMSFLLNLGRDEEASRLLEQYDDAMASWAYSKALLAFRRLGDSPEARHLLRRARRQNRYVPEYLLGSEPVPIERPDHYGRGDRNEALCYVQGGLSAWRSTPGAITWVREVLAEPGVRPAVAKAWAGPSPGDRERLERLPQPYDVWQAGFRQLLTWIRAEGRRVIPWVALVASRESGRLLATKILTEQPSAGVLWDLLAGAMKRPGDEEPRRPTRIEVQPEPRWDELGPHLDRLGIELEACEALEFFEELFEDLGRHLAEDEPPGLLDVPRVTTKVVAGFFEAAAAFYRRAPWRSLGYERAIKVECERFQSGPWYAVVMGQSGVTLGLALYEDLDLLRRLWANRAHDEENARRTVALAVTYDPVVDVHPRHLDAARRHGWEVANPESYPSVYRKERGMVMRPPLAWELVLLEGCLRSLPDFLSRHKPDDPGRHPVTVPVSTGKLDLMLSWVADL
jgi:tetratricopeptide (TPR) repeat protein